MTCHFTLVKKSEGISCFLIFRAIGNLPGLFVLQFSVSTWVHLKFQGLNKKQYIALKAKLLTTPEVSFYYD